MPKVTLSPIDPSVEVIPADATRTYLEFSATADCRYSMTETYEEEHSQPLRAGQVRTYEGTLAQTVFSFSNGKDTVVYFSQLPAL